VVFPTSALVVGSKHMCLRLVLLALCTLNVWAADSAFKTRHVFIFVIDGPRWSETWGEPQRQYIPVRNTQLAPQGVVCLEAFNDGPTYTNAGHTALVTGFYQNINNNGLELPAHPTLTQYLMRDKKLEKEKNWIIASKDKLQILVNSRAVGWKHQHVCSFNCGVDGAGVGAGYRDDATTLSVTKEIMLKHRPHFMLVNFKEPDSSGHANKWDNYLAGITTTDRYVGELWSLIQADPELKDRTTVFITNDHGRHPDGHLDGFINHGDDCAGCRKIELLAIGPDFKRGVVSKERCGQIDIAVTAAALLGVQLAGSPGRIMNELFTQTMTGSP
jgi:predicted AlkP superfamily pyrophosphatase or phosphodiesterase